MPKRTADANEIDRVIGGNLKWHRTLHGLTRAELGEGLTTPVTQQAVSKYEDGATRIPSGNLAEFAAMMKCKVSDLFDGVDTILRGGEHTPAPALDRKGEKLMRDYQQIDNPALQAVLCNMAHALVLELSTNLRRIERHE